jgi:uncharacterized protein (TIGR02996 family)
VPSEDTFLQAILESPDDYSPRLLFADWLDERGDPRGELIRVQCELASLGYDPALPAFGYWLFGDWDVDLASLTAVPAWQLERQSDLLDLEWQLLDQNEGTWIAPMRDMVGPCPMSSGELRDFVERPKRIEEPLYGWDFRRGLVETVRMEARAFVRDADRLLLSAPIHDVWLYRPAGWIRSLAGLPVLARLTALDLGEASIYHHGMDCIRDADLVALAAYPYLSNLTTLGLSYHDIGIRGVKALVNSPNFPRLTALNLGSNPFLTEPRGVETLARSPVMERLTVLLLGSDAGGISFEMGDAGVAVLADSPRSAGLRTLGLNSSGLGLPGIEALAASPSLSGLEVLDLGDNDLGDEGASALALAPPWSKLRMLDLDDNGIGDAGAAALAGAAWLPQLQALNLNRNKIGASGLRALLESTDLSRLQVLGLGENHVHDQGIAWLTAAPGLTDLRLLDLFNAGIGEEGVVALAHAPSLARLRMLKLHGSRPGPRGIEALAASPCLGHLRELDLSYSALGDAEADLLASAPSLERLTRLRVAGNSFTEWGVEALRSRFGRRVVLA